MNKLFEGLDSAAIEFAIRRTALRVIVITAISVIACCMVMIMVTGQVYAIGLICASVMPLVLSTPSTLSMNLKHQHLRAANKKLEILASTDCLTGALNRRAFADPVTDWLDVPAATNPVARGALMVIDVDRFKHINDTYGHDAGDLTLKILVNRVRTSLPETGLLGRIGGEEFAVFLKDTDVEQAALTATEICKSINQTDFSPAGINTTISVSIGVALAAPGVDLQQLFRDADTKLYQAKKEGRNRVILATTNNESSRRAA